MLKQFFSRNGSQKSEPTRPQATTTRNLSVESLKNLIPIRNLSEEELTAFSLSQPIEIFPQDAVLFKQGEKVESIFYLLDGSIALDSGASSAQSLSSSHFKAKFPLSTGTTHSITARAETEIAVLRVPARILEMGNTNYQAQKIVLQNPEDFDKASELDTSVLFHAFYNQFSSQQIVLPTLPNVAIKLKNAMSGDIGIAQAAKIVQLDPSISAKIIQVANSPLYRAAEPTRTCLDAAKRLGLKALRSLVISFSMKQVFQCENKKIQKRMEQYWTESIYLSSLCYLIASKVQKAEAEQALLAGLMCDIGMVPFLHFAANFPTDLYDDSEIEQTIPLIKTPVGLALMKKWEFSDEIAEIPATSEDWFRNSGDQLSLSEIVMLAKLHSYIGKPKAQQLPFIETVPAFAKLNQTTLDPAASLEILNRANQRVRNVSNVFI